ncbi:MAG: hypothetical protein ACK5MR_11080 [Cumulibacter sp.]
MSTSTKSTSQPKQRSFFERLTSADEASSHSVAARPAAGPASPRRKPLGRHIRLGALIGIAIVLYAVQAPVLGAVYGLRRVGDAAGAAGLGRRRTRAL